MEGKEMQSEYAFDEYISKFSAKYDLSVLYISASDIICNLDNILVVDCRDIDYVGGNIRGSLHIPDSKMYLNPFFYMSEILKTANKKNTKNIVFHCMESQIRGPKCATKFKLFLDFIKESNNWNIFILEGGFEQWVRKYYNNPNLVENFDSEYWLFAINDIK